MNYCVANDIPLGNIIDALKVWVFNKYYINYEYKVNLTEEQKKEKIDECIKLRGYDFYTRYGSKYFGYMLGTSDNNPVEGEEGHIAEDGYKVQKYDLALNEISEPVFYEDFTTIQIGDMIIEVEEADNDLGYKIYSKFGDTSRSEITLDLITEHSNFEEFSNLDIANYLKGKINVYSKINDSNEIEDYYYLVHELDKEYIEDNEDALFYMYCFNTGDYEIKKGYPVIALLDDTPHLYVCRWEIYPNTVYIIDGKKFYSSDQVYSYCTDNGLDSEEIISMIDYTANGETAISDKLFVLKDAITEFSESLELNGYELFTESFFNKYDYTKGINGLIIKNDEDLFSCMKDVYGNLENENYIEELESLEYENSSLIVYDESGNKLPEYTYIYYSVNGEIFSTEEDAIEYCTNNDIDTSSIIEITNDCNVLGTNKEKFVTDDGKILQHLDLAYVEDDVDYLPVYKDSGISSIQSNLYNEYLYYLIHDFVGGLGFYRGSTNFLWLLTKSGFKQPLEQVTNSEISYWDYFGTDVIYYPDKNNPTHIITGYRSDNVINVKDIYQKDEDEEELESVEQIEATFEIEGYFVYGTEFDTMEAAEDYCDENSVDYSEIKLTEEFEPVFSKIFRDKIYYYYFLSGSSNLKPKDYSMAGWKSVTTDFIYYLYDDPETCAPNYIISYQPSLVGLMYAWHTPLPQTTFDVSINEEDGIVTYPNGSINFLTGEVDMSKNYELIYDDFRLTIAYYAPNYYQDRLFIWYRQFIDHEVFSATLGEITSIQPFLSVPDDFLENLGVSWDGSVGERILWIEFYSNSNVVSKFYPPLNAYGSARSPSTNSIGSEEAWNAYINQTINYNERALQIFPTGIDTFETNKISDLKEGYLGLSKYYSYESSISDCFECFSIDFEGDINDKAKLFKYNSDTDSYTEFNTWEYMNSNKDPIYAAYKANFVFDFNDSGIPLKIEGVYYKRFRFYSLYSWDPVGVSNAGEEIRDIKINNFNMIDNGLDYFNLDEISSVWGFIENYVYITPNNNLVVVWREYSPYVVKIWKNGVLYEFEDYQGFVVIDDYVCMYNFGLDNKFKIFSCSSTGVYNITIEGGGSIVSPYVVSDDDYIYFIYPSGDTGAAAFKKSDYTYTYITGTNMADLGVTGTIGGYKGKIVANEGIITLTEDGNGTLRPFLEEIPSDVIAQYGGQYCN